MHRPLALPKRLDLFGLSLPKLPTQTEPTFEIKGQKCAALHRVKSKRPSLIGLLKRVTNVSRHFLKSVNYLSIMVKVQLWKYNLKIVFPQYSESTIVEAQFKNWGF